MYKVCKVLPASFISNLISPPCNGFCVVNFIFRGDLFILILMTLPNVVNLLILISSLAPHVLQFIDNILETQLLRICKQRRFISLINILY